MRIASCRTCRSATNLTWRCWGLLPNARYLQRQIMTKTLMGPERPRGKLRACNGNTAALPVRSKQSFIQWPTEQEIQKVSQRLARIQRVGICSEANGDYFRSGDLAYQIQEIIRATAELFKKSQRAKG